MPPQTNIRLDPELKAHAIAAAEVRGISLSRLIEVALDAYLGGDTTLHQPAPDTTLHQQVADLAARVAALEAQQIPLRPRSYMETEIPVSSDNTPKRPRQNRQQGASTRSPRPEPPTGSEGLTTGAALVSAKADLTEAQAMGTNYDALMVRRYGVKAAAWLIDAGWVKQGKKWYPPK